MFGSHLALHRSNELGVSRDSGMTHRSRLTKTETDSWIGAYVPHPMRRLALLRDEIAAAQMLDVPDLYLVADCRCDGRWW